MSPNSVLKSRWKSNNVFDNDCGDSPVESYMPAVLNLRIPGPDQTFLLERCIRQRCALLESSGFEPKSWQLVVADI